MITIRYTYTEKHALDAQREITRVLAPWQILVPLIGWIMMIGIAYAWIVNGIAPWQGVNPALVGPLFCITPWLTSRKLRKQFRSSPEAGLEQTWHITDSSLASESHGSNATFEWSKLVRVKERPKGFLLFPQPRLAYWIPLSAFSSATDIDTFRAYIAQSPIPRKG